MTTLKKATNRQRKVPRWILMHRSADASNLLEPTEDFMTSRSDSDSAYARAPHATVAGLHYDAPTPTAYIFA